MLIKTSTFVVGDNTNIKKGYCLRILKSARVKTGGLSDLILFSIKKAKNKKKYIKKNIYYGLIVGLKKKVKRLNGTYIKFSKNKVITLNDQFQFLGTRIHGPVCKELKATKALKDKYTKAISYCKRFV